MSMVTNLIDYVHIGHVVSFRDRVRWIRLQDEKPDDDESVSKWWPGVLYRDYRELMRDVHPEDTQFKAHCFLQHDQFKGAVVYLLGYSKQNNAPRQYHVQRLPHIPTLRTNADFDSLNGDGQDLKNYFDFYDDLMPSWMDTSAEDAAVQSLFITALQEIQTALVHQFVKEHKKLGWMDDVNILHKTTSLNVKPSAVFLDNSLHNPSTQHPARRVTLEPIHHTLMPFSSTLDNTSNMPLSTFHSPPSTKIAASESLMYDKEKEHDSWIEEQEGHDLKDSPSQNENDCMSDVSSSDDEVNIQINVHDDWADVWEKLKRMGWCWRAGRGLVDYYYIFPKGKLKGGKEGIDYFTSETELQEYVRRTHGWKNRSQEIHKEEIVSFIPREEMSTIKRSKSDIDSSPYSVKKRKIIVDIEDSDSHFSGIDENDSLSSDDNIQPNEPWADVWQKLKRQGWSWKAGGGLVAYNYVFPGGKIKGGKEGVDYFTSEADLQHYVGKTYGWNRSTGMVSYKPIQEMLSTNRPSKSDYESSPYSVKKRKIIMDSDCFDDNFDDNDSLSSDDNIKPNDSWAAAWEKLKRQGWWWKAGGGLVAYYYVFPGGKVKGGKEGIDFFIDEEDLKDYIRRTHGWNGGGNDGQTPHQRARCSLRRPDYYYA